MFQFLRRNKLNKYEISELQQLNQMAIAEEFKANVIKANTALVENGQRLAKQCEQVAKLLNDMKSQKLSMILAGLGYPSGTQFQVDLLTGKIKIVKKEEVKEEKKDVRP